MSFALTACAQKDSGGGFGAAGLTTVQDVLNLRRDDVPVTLQGRIIYHIRSDYYRFADETGKIRIEIPPRIWGSLRVTADDLIEVTGIVDRGLLRRNYVEIRSIRILTNESQENNPPTP